MDEESGLYYYGMRYYAAWLCRFVSVDPLAAKYAFYTPYQYAGNKPINATDLDGAEEKPVVDSGGQGSPANLGRPSQAVPQDATRRAPPSHTVPVHNVVLPPDNQTYIRQGNGPQEQRRYNNAAKGDASIKANNESSPLLGGGEPGNALGLARTLGTASVEVPRALVIEAAAVYAFSYLGTVARLVSRASATAEVAGKLAPTVSRASAAAEGYASWGEATSNFRAVPQPFEFAPARTPFRPCAEMNNSETEDFNHAISRHGKDFGLSWGSKETLSKLVEDFNIRASEIRTQGTFVGAKRVPYGQKGAGKPSEKVIAVS